MTIQVPKPAVLPMNYGGYESPQWESNPLLHVEILRVGSFRMDIRSRRRDSNSRSRGPKPRALARLRYATLKALVRVKKPERCQPSD